MYAKLIELGRGPTPCVEYGCASGGTPLRGDCEYGGSPGGP